MLPVRAELNDMESLICACLRLFSKPNYWSSIFYEIFSPNKLIDRCNHSQLKLALTTHRELSCLAVDSLSTVETISGFQ